LSVSSSAAAPAERLNFVVILADDLGYGDLGSFGHPAHRTPHLDRLAEEGVRFTDFYVPAPVCTPTRAAFLTGRYPLRAGLTALLWPEDTTGLPPGELTLPELLRQAGYATHLSGKWHLGHTPAHLPRAHGFDHWFGMPYPNDMDGRHPRSVAMKLNWGPLPLMRDAQVVEQPADVNQLTENYTADAEAFIAAQRERPFFLFLSHAMPHTWLGASEAFRGRSRNGLYGDAVEELDASVGRIRAALKRAGVAERTVIFFTSDNGAVLPPNPANAKAISDARIMFPDSTYGSNRPLRGGKQDVLEGGVRVPAIAFLPGGVRGVVARAPAAIQDVFPTVLSLAGLPLPADRSVDGRSLAPVLRGNGERESTDFFFGSETLLALRSGPWKFLERRSIRASDARQPAVDELYRIDVDPGEKQDVAAEHPELVRTFKTLLAGKQQELEAEAQRRGYRPAATSGVR
jgi:arylsulfatase A-like enzyme